MTEPAAHRYAVYYAPSPDSSWWAAGSQWLGRCAAQDQRLAQPTVTGLTATEFSALTAAPRRYGWHATLKAPFALAEGISLATLRAALQSLGQSLNSFAMPTLRVARMEDFLALVPHGNADSLQSVAAACVTQLHALAAPLGAAELLRRRQTLLTPEQEQMLVRWGYPHVMEHFKFHCSLTGPLKSLSTMQIDAVQGAAESLFHNLPACRFNTLALFAEPTPGAEFLLLDHFGLRP